MSSCSSLEILRHLSAMTLYKPSKNNTIKHFYIYSHSRIVSSFSFICRFLVCIFSFFLLMMKQSLSVVCPVPLSMLCRVRSSNDLQSGSVELQLVWASLFVFWALQIKRIVARGWRTEKNDVKILISLDRARSRSMVLISRLVISRSFTLHLA